MEDINTKIENGGATADGRLSAAEYNDRNDELETAVERSGQTLTVSETTQLAEALFLNGTKAHSFQDNGAVNAVDLRPISGASGVKVPASYDDMDGAIVSFKPAVNNTGAVTVDIGQTAGIGTQDLVLSTDFSALTGSELDTTVTAQIQYDLAGTRWLLLPWSLPAAVISFPILVSQGGSGATTAAGARTNFSVPPLSRDLTVSGLLTGGGTLASDRNFDVTASSQPQAEAGVDNTTAMTPLRVSQAILALGGTGGIVAVTTITATGLTVFDPSVNGSNRVLMIATAGGGGSGSPNAKTNVGEMSASAGGGAGGTMILFYEFNTGATTLDVTVGPGGVGAADSSGAAGGLGGVTTVVESDGPAATLITCTGGGGSSGTISGSGITSGIKLVVGVPGGTSTGAGLTIQGGNSHGSSTYADELTAIGGNGAASFWGGGARGIVTAGGINFLPINALAKGSGAGGAATRRVGAGSQDSSGADGAPGVVLIIEYA